jgi:Neurotransmitter-gated ion-channel ligand binding domain
VFLQVVWLDQRIKPKELGPKHYIELTMEQRNDFWVPDLYIRQLREMKISKVFEEISSLRIYENSTISLSIGATIIIKCDMDFVLYPLDVQFCPVDFSSCESHQHCSPGSTLKFLFQTNTPSMR